MPNHTTRPRQSVLIVEDDPSTRLALVHLLRHLGYDSVPVATVAEGMERLNGQHRAILDLNLPDGLGLHVLQRIREERRPIRVMMASASTDEALLAEVRRLGVELLLVKPINVNTLVEWLERDG